MKTHLLRVAIVSLFLQGAAFAGDWGSLGKGVAPLAGPVVDDCLSYDFIDLHYITTGFGNPYLSRGHGFGVGASMLVSQHLYLNASYSLGSFDDSWCGCFDGGDTHRYRFGAGLRAPIAKCVDLTFEGGAEYHKMEWDKSFHRDYDSWGYYVGPGIRARHGKLETFASVHLYSREGDHSQQYLDPQFRTGDYRTGYTSWRFSTGLIYHVTDRLGVRVAGEFDRYDNLFSVGTRYHF